MSISLRVILIIASVVTAICIFVKIRKSQVRIEDAVYWIITSILLVVISIVPGIAEFFSNLIGIMSPANFIFLCIIFILLIKVFSLSIRSSQLDNKLSSLVQRFALQQHDIDVLKSRQTNPKPDTDEISDSDSSKNSSHP